VIQFLITTPQMPRPAASERSAPAGDAAVLSAPLREPSSSSGGGGRLMFLDGMRALASLYVVLHHCVQIYQDPDASPRYEYYAFIPWLLRGRAVAFFMVLSGFCLMIPVAKSGSGGLRDRFWAYLKRRIHRIVPCYYAAVALTLSYVLFVPGMDQASGEFWGRAVPPFSVGNLLSHALLLHWLSPQWIYRINPPLWTLGTEWVLYFIFPLILLPIWRRLGLTAVVVAGVVMGFGPHVLLRKTAWHFDWACPWLIGLFAIGMAGAVLQLSPKLPKGADAVRRLAVGPFGVAALALSFAALWRYRVAMDYLFGLGALWIIFYCGSPAVGGVTPTFRLLLTNLLQSRPLRAVGRFSYSLYLIHGPVLMLIYRRIDARGLSANARAALMFLVAPPIAVAAAYLFHRLVERPLMPAAGPTSGSAPRRSEPARPDGRRRASMPASDAGSLRTERDRDGVNEPSTRPR
jgi:peptidoglycan/LPS O-acetylase OafA/YrhL